MVAEAILSLVIALFLMVAVITGSVPDDWLRFPESIVLFFISVVSMPWVLMFISVLVILKLLGLNLATPACPPPLPSEIAADLIETFPAAVISKLAVGNLAIPFAVAVAIAAAATVLVLIAVTKPLALTVITGTSVAEPCDPVSLLTVASVVENGTLLVPLKSMLVAVTSPVMLNAL